MEPAKPKLYVVQRKVLAATVQEAISKERETEIDSVFPDTTAASESRADAIGFKHVPVPE